MEIKEFTPNQLESLQKRFDFFCKKTITNSIKNEIRGFLRYCNNHKVVSLDEWIELLEGVSDEYLSEKSEVKAGSESIFFESWQLAEAIQKLPERKRLVLLFAVALEYPIEDVAVALNITHKTATNYKYQALKALREEIVENGKKKK